MAKLLIISYNFPPDNAPAAQRPAAFYKYCSSETVVLTAKGAVSALGAEVDDNFAHDDNVVRVGNVDILKGGVAGSVKAARANSWKKKLFNELKIPDKAIVWYRSALKAALLLVKEHGDFTHVFSTSPSVVNHMVASKVAKKYGLTWIADFRDYYYLETIEKGEFYFRPAIDRFIERRIMRSADHLVFISRTMRKLYADRYPQISDKCSAIYNGFDLSEVPSSHQPLPDRLTIFYAGTFYKGLRDPLPLFAALDSLASRGIIDLDRIVVQVAGHLDGHVQESIMSYGSGQCLDYIGLLPRSEVLRRYQTSHLLWLIIGNTVNHYTGFPIKGYEYMAAGRPILLQSPVPAEGTAILGDVGHGYILDSNDPRNHAAVVETAYRDYLSGKLDIAIPIDHLAQYTRVFQASQLDRLLREVR